MSNAHSVFTTWHGPAGAASAAAGPVAAGKCVVLHDLWANGGHKYHLFRGESIRDAVQLVEAYIRSIPAGQSRNYNEVIPADAPQKFKFDIDYPVNNDADYNEALGRLRRFIGEIVDASKAVYDELYGESLLSSDFVICESNHPEEKSKVSAHIILKRMAPDAIEVCGFSREVVERLSPGAKSLVDTGVNAGTLHNLRIAGCCKDNSRRVKRLPKGATLFDSLVLTPCAPIPHRAFERDDMDAQMPSASDLDGDICGAAVREIIEATKARWGPYQAPLKCVGRTIVFSRLRASQCDLCGREHTHDNTYQLKVRRVGQSAEIHECCRRQPGVLGPCIARLCPRPSTNPATSTAEQQPPPPIRRMRYDSDRMENYPFPARTMFVKAPMKLGKTKELSRYIAANFPRTSDRRPIVFVSFRQMFSSAIRRSFPDFAVYSDIKGPLVAERLIVQVESLHRINPATYGRPALVILDESESIIDQLDSGLSSEQAYDFAVFQWLIAHSESLIAMDAFLSERTLRVIERMRGLDGAVIVENTNRNATADSYYITSNRDLWLAALYASLDAHLPVAIPTNSATEGRLLAQLLADRYPTARIKFYSAETLASVRKRDLANVDEAWRDLDVLIYSPTITAGVSFEVPRFARIFGYFSDLSCPAQTCVQMMGRIRNVALHQSIICISANPSSLPETKAAILDYMATRKWALLNEIGAGSLPVEFDAAGRPSLPDSPFAEMKIQNMVARNKSKNDFERVFRGLITAGGAAVAELIQPAWRAIFGDSVPFPTDAALTDISGGHKGVGGFIKAARHAAIAAADTIDGTTANTIQAKSKAGADVPESERMALEKFRIASTYGVPDEAIHAGFVETYGDKGVRKRFRNLSRLVRATRGTQVGDEVSLAAVRRTEREFLRGLNGAEAADIRELAFAYSYEAHRLACGLAQACGFVGPLDPQLVPCIVLAANLTAALPAIQKASKQIAAEFKFVSIPRLWTLDAALKITREVLREHYAVELVKCGQNYRLELDPIFAIRDGRVMTETGPP